MSFSKLHLAMPRSRCFGLRCFCSRFAVRAPKRPVERSLLLVEEGVHRLIGGVEVQLRDDFVRSVHGEDRRADVDDVDVQGREVHGDRSAAARVDLAELARLPDDALLVEEPADFAEELRGGVRGGVLAAGARVLADADALRDVGRVVRLHRFRVGRVHAGRDVGGQALGRGEDVVAGDAGVLAEILDEVFEVGGVEAGVAVGADGASTSKFAMAAG